MINRYLSMGEDFLPLVNHFQNYVINEMPHGIDYRFYCDLLPKKKMYLKYIKGKKDKFNKEIINYIVEYFEVSRLQASEYIPLIPKESMKNLLREFGKNEKEIKKLVR